MKKYLLLLLLLALPLSMAAQKYYTKTGFTEFKASVEAFEPVEAKNNSSTAILNTETGEVAALLFVKAFRFKVALMEEHFNENYMDSDKHPKAKFKGKLVDFDFEDLSEKAKEYQLEGTLTIKAIEKPVDTKVSLIMLDGTVQVTGTFSVKPEEFEIEIPGIVSEKIAETIDIYMDYELVKK